MYVCMQAAHTVYRNTRWIKVSDGLYLEQEAVPMGVALCVFDDTCPDVVAQVWLQTYDTCTPPHTPI